MSTDDATASDLPADETTAVGATAERPATRTNPTATAARTNPTATGATDAHAHATGNNTTTAKRPDPTTTHADTTTAKRPDPTTTHADTTNPTAQQTNPTTAGDDATAIANELFRYAELIDAGRFADVGELMEHCSFVYGLERTPGPSGSRAIADSYRSMVITYVDGTPRTRHVTTNPIISIDGDTAEVRSVYTVTQQAAAMPLQAIVSGRYRDRLRRIDGRWRFVERQFLVDFVGDLSRHLRLDLPSDLDHPTSRQRDGEEPATTDTTSQEEPR